MSGRGAPRHDLAMYDNGRPGLRAGLAVLAGFVAVAALGGAAALAFGAIDMGEVINGRLPWHSPALGGLALALFVAVPMAAVAVSAAAGNAHVGELAMAAGGLLVGWIGVQLVVIRTFSWLQPVMVAAGLAVFAMGLLLRTHSAQHG